MEFPYIVRNNLVIVDASSPVFHGQGTSVIDMTLTIADAANGTVTIPFSACSYDSEEHGRLLHAYALAGNMGTVAPAVEDLDITKANAYRLNNEAYISITESVTKSYPELEKDTWPTQQREVIAWMANPDAPTPWINIAAAARGIDRIDYLQRSYAKASQFEAVSAYLTGLRQKYEDCIKAATTVAQVKAVALVYQLPQG